MMRFTFFLLFICLFNGNLISQEKWLTLNGGINFSTTYFTLADSVVLTDRITGYSISLKFDRTISTYSTLSSGIMLQSKGYSLNTVSGLKTKYNIHYIEVPLQLTFRFEIGEPYAFFTGGFFVSRALAGNTKSGSQNSKIEFGNLDGMFKTIDYGISIGWGFEFESIIVGMNYSIGLNDIASSRIETIYNRSLLLHIGYKLGL